MRLPFSVLSGPTHITSDGKFARPMTLAYFQNGGFVTVAEVNGSYVSLAPIQWPGGNVPPDSPKCGWNGGECEDETCELLLFMLSKTINTIVFIRRLKYTDTYVLWIHNSGSVCRFIYVDISKLRACKPWFYLPLYFRTSIVSFILTSHYVCTTDYICGYLLLEGY